MPATVRVPVLLNEKELRAAHLACSNYTARDGPWMQHAQAQAVSKFDTALRIAVKKNKEARAKEKEKPSGS